MMMKILLALAGSVLLCASVVSGAGSLMVPVHPAAWFPSVSALGYLSLSEPVGLLILGAGLVSLARPARRKPVVVAQHSSPPDR